MRFGWVALALFLLTVVQAPVAQAEKRMALLIGNEAYASQMGQLGNPHNDVALLEQALKGLGFEVVTVRDAGLGTLYQTVSAYSRRLQVAGPGVVGFFYYSGHGASDGIRNYLIPVDVKTTETGELWDQSVPLTEVTRKLKAEAGNATHFVVFDACRNTLKLTQPGSRAVVQSKGFVPVAQENGMLIAYATAEGELASDVGTGAGPYAKVLAEEIVKPGIEAVVMFRSVQRRVRTTIGQEPYLGFNSLGDIYLAGRAPEVIDAAREWARVDKTSVAELETFMRRHGSSPEADYARARIDALKRQVAAAAPAKVPEHPKDSFRDCSSCPEMIVVPAGSFTMGSPENELGRLGYFEVQVRVSIPAPFAAGKFAVTFDEWNACAADGGCNGYKPVDEGWGRGKRPVINVNWDDAKGYTAWLSRKTGKIYRLLSEAEREYVTRAGTTTPFWWGSSITPQRANYDNDRYGYSTGSTGEYRQRTVPVDSFEPNPWGFYNVHGNVSEWTEDCWNESKANPGDGRPITTGNCAIRAVRGGSWNADAHRLRSAYRSGGIADIRLPSLGFRLARTLNP